MSTTDFSATSRHHLTSKEDDLQLDLRKAIHGINPMLKFTPTVNGYAYHIPYALGNPQRGMGKSSHHPDAKVANSHRSPVPRRFL
jgi:hypothetical protein